MDYVDIIGYAAIGLSSCFYLTLALPFFNVLRCKENFEYTPIAIINTVYVDSVAWYIYGTKLSVDQIILGNQIGACCTLALIIIYLAFEIRKYLIDTILNALILILGTLVLHKGLTMVVEDTQVVGKICIGTKLLTFCIPMLMVYKVCKEKNYGVISLNNTIICCSACLAWGLFGKCLNDINAMCANGLGVLLCLVQIAVYLTYKSKYPHYSGPAATIGIETTTSSEDVKKDENSSINIDDDNQDKSAEKPVKIVGKF